MGRCQLLRPTASALGVSGGAPMQYDLSVLVTMQAAFMTSSRAQTNRCSAHESTANNHRTWLQHAGHELVCLVPEWTSICLCLPGLFEPDFAHILRAFYSADIGITNTSSCDSPTCFMPELVAGSASVSLKPQISLQLTAYKT